LFSALATRAVYSFARRSGRYGGRPHWLKPKVIDRDLPATRVSASSKHPVESAGVLLVSAGAW